ncbi:TonB-dependent receptor [Paracrocinitomix mangrovi]|uniref:TonB-dependent receptor plug domain-containing protein n=1 Tax=Paracrocinitomix mangrovi TaxID=2862509 RepID=UPI001EDBD6A2|nr:TonB-dependent receptor [Paracrocinitomix mangrovi]UKN02120.1 TonB-dependent receptor [Paracrocinitomix mangrovi]
MKKLVVFCTLMLCYQFGFGQVLTIRDQETTEPLELVSLISYKPSIVEQTNARGQVDISAFEGAERIEIVLLGYKKEVKSYEELANSTLELSLIPLAFSTDAVVVSASKWSQNLKDIPNKIVTINPIDVSIKNPQTTADLLASTGQVFVQKSQLGGGSPMIRGFATNRLLYVVDGIRMNTAIFRGGNIQNVISIDPFALERSEILFGPGSVIYGSDAIGAVMSFQTLIPELSLTDDPLVNGKALMRYSSASNEKTGHFDINVGWKKWALLTNFSANDFGDVKMGSYGPDEYLRPFYVKRQDSMDVIVTNDDPRVQSPSGYQQMNFMQKVRFKPNRKWTFDYGFHYSETSDYARYDRHIRYKNGLPRYGEWNYGPQKWMMNLLSIVHQGNNPVYDKMDIRIAQQSFEESRISRDFNDPMRERRVENVYAFSANADFNKAIGKNNQLFYGVEYVQNEVVSRGVNEDISTGIKTPGASRYPQAMWYSMGAYISDQHKINGKFTLNGGIRYNQYIIEAEFDTNFYPFPYTSASLNNGALTGNLGLIYRPTEKWKINLNLSTGFRSPNVDDMGKVFDSEPGTVVVPNPDLKAEYAYNAEIGVSKTFGDFLQIDVTGFYTVLQNALVRRDFTLNGMDSIMYDGELSKVEAIQNAAVATVYGVNASVILETKRGFGLTSHFNWQMGEEELDDGSVSPSRHAAPWFGITSLNYTYKKLMVQFYAQYSGEKTYEQLPISEQAKDYIYAIDANGNPYSPAWYTVNFKANYQFTENLTVSSGIENITDQRYRPYSSGIVSPGRNFILSLKVKF